VGDVPTFQATDTDLPIVSTDLFGGFQYFKNSFKMKIYKRYNRFIA
jgi:hypothetical protein